MKTNPKRKAIILFLSIIATYNIYAQPYNETYVKNKYVEENVFKKMKEDTSTTPSFNEIKNKLPAPFWAKRPDVIKCYWRAWEIGFSRLFKVKPNSGFVYPSIDAFTNENIFMWDNCFMTMFYNYGIRAYNFQKTLNNFYAKQHIDGFICREIRRVDGTDAFERTAVSSTGPFIMPWAEWDYFLNNSDTTRLKQVFPVLLAYYQNYKENRTWQDGSYFGSGLSSGMDNQPRIPGNKNSQATNHSTGHLSWVDINLQQILSGKIIVDMSKILNRTAETEDINEEIKFLTTYVNTKMYDNKSNFYYDRQRNGELTTVKTIGSYWALLAGVVSPLNQKQFINHLSDTNEFNRPHRIPTLSADNPAYKPNWGYWLGGVWAPTNYMVLKGLTKYGQDSLAYEIATNHLNNVVSVFNTTNTLWENYSPEKVEGQFGKEFVGWTGLPPISVLYEYVFGIRKDVPKNTIVWDVRLTDEFGVNNFAFGKHGLVNLKCNKRKKDTDQPKINIKSTTDFTLLLKWNGGSKKIFIKKNMI